MRKPFLILSAVGIAAAAAGGTALVMRTSQGPSLQNAKATPFRATWAKSLGRKLTEKEGRQVDVFYRASVMIGASGVWLNMTLNDAIQASKERGVNEGVKIGLTSYGMGEPLGGGGEQWERIRAVLRTAYDTVNQIEDGLI